MFFTDDNKPQKITRWTVQEATVKIKTYCAYQERCHYDVFTKLKQHGITINEANEIISTLIQENYLNEERFVVQYAGGKSRLKKWGKEKIIAALKQKGITSAYLLKLAIKEINTSLYDDNLQLLAQKKYESLKQYQYLIRLKKTQNYLLQKGYTLNEVLAVTKNFVKAK